MRLQLLFGGWGCLGSGRGIGVEDGLLSKHHMMRKLTRELLSWEWLERLSLELLELLELLPLHVGGDHGHAHGVGVGVGSETGGEGRCVLEGRSWGRDLAVWYCAASVGRGKFMRLWGFGRQRNGGGANHLPKSPSEDQRVNLAVR